MDPVSFRDALDSGKTIVFSATCSIRYSGRAESFLDDGDRLIIIKGDKTLLIHQPSGSLPINYMKEGTAYDIGSAGEKINIVCRNGKELMSIDIHRIHYYNFHDLIDDQKLQITGSEKDMSMMIFSNPGMIEPGFRPLSMEEHTKFGFIDVFGYDLNNILVVVECKRYVADPKAVEQLKRYVDKIKATKGLSNVRGILACPRLTPSAAEMLKQSGFEFRSISPPKYFEKFDSGQKRLEF